MVRYKKKIFQSFLVYQKVDNMVDLSFYELIFTVYIIIWSLNKGKLYLLPTSFALNSTTSLALVMWGKYSYFNYHVPYSPYQLSPSFDD